MNHWLNWNTETQNVIVSNNFSLCVGSCSKDLLFSVDQKLSAGVPIAAVLDNSPLSIITFKSLIGMRYARNGTNILIRYRTSNEEKSLEIELGSKDKAEELFDHISQYIASTLIKRVGDAHRHYGLVLAVCSVIFAAVFLYSFFNVNRLVAYVIPVVSILSTLAYVFRLEGIQRRVTRWTTKSDGKNLRIPAFRALGACFIFCTLALCISPLFPDQYGQSALFSAAKRGSLDAGKITTYLDRGSSINYVHKDNTTALWWSIQNQAESVSLGLIEKGADISANDGGLLEHAIQNQASEILLSAMLKKGALEAAELIGKFDTKYFLKMHDTNFTTAYRRHRNTY